MTPLILAAAQTTPVRGDVAVNLEQHLRLTAAAARKGARLLVFPELSLTGYELDLADGLAFGVDDPRIEPLRQAAARYRMTLVVGAPLRLDSGLHIACFVIRPDPPIAVYTKLYVHESEAHVFRPCALNPLIELGDVTAAIAICADTKNRRHVERAAGLGAGVYLSSVFVTPAGYPADTELLRSYAVQHSMTIVLANYGGPTGDLDSAGESAIWGPDGRQLASLPASGAGLVIATRDGTAWSGTSLRSSKSPPPR